MRLLPRTLSEVGPAVRTCVVYDGSATASLKADDPAWTDEADRIIRYRLDAVALEILSRSPEFVTPELLARFKAASLASALRTIAVEHAARAALSALNDSEIPFAIVKGPAMARFYDHPDLRSFNDIDIVVEPSRYRQTVQVLNGIDFIKEFDIVEPWSWYELICHEGVNLHRGDGGNLDVHHHLSPWIYSKKIKSAELIERSEKGIFGGVPVRFASGPDSLVVASLHVLNDLWKADPSLITWRDINTLLGLLGIGPADDALENAGIGWIGPAIFTGAEALRSGEAELFERRFPVNPGRNLRLKLLGWDEPSSVSDHHAGGWAFRLPAAQAFAFVAGGVIPSASFARSKSGGYLQYWKTSVSTICNRLRRKPPS